MEALTRLLLGAWMGYTLAILLRPSMPTRRRAKQYRRTIHRLIYLVRLLDCVCPAHVRPTHKIWPRG